MPDKDLNQDIIGMLYKISNTLSPGNDIETAIKPVLELMSEKLGMLRGMITIFNRQSGEIFIEDSFGLTSEAQAKGRYMPGEGVTGRVVESGEPIIVPNIFDSEILLDKTKFRDQSEKEQICFICIPIRSTNHVIGTISANKLYESEEQLEMDTQLLTIISTMISRVVRLHQTIHEENRLLMAENRRLYEELAEKKQNTKVIGNSNTMRHLFEMINKVVSTPTTVLILGESGVGKERVAETIHFQSDRSDKPFVKFNCAALPENLIESELFGYEKGAFTGAVSTRIGKFHQADQGTIFLDEIGELSANAQSKLLRVLQEKEFERVGGNRTFKVDVRIIAATNRNLKDLAAKGEFREDLYYRLNVFPLEIPALRERRTDIPLLVDFFITRLSEKLGKDVATISAPAMDTLVNYDWPGNVRELENCIERAIILADNNVIRTHNLSLNVQEVSKFKQHFRGSLEAQLENLEYEIVTQEIIKAKGNASKAAKSLGLTVRKIGLRIDKYGIDVNKFKGD